MRTILHLLTRPQIKQGQPQGVAPTMGVPVGAGPCACPENLRAGLIGSMRALNFLPHV